MLVVCNLLVINAGCIFSLVMVDMNNFNSERVIKNTTSAIWFLSHFLAILCTVYFFVACVSAFCFSYAFFATLTFPIIWTVCENIFYALMFRISSYYIYPNHEFTAVICLHTFGGNTMCYISCWLVIGIRINPSRGLTVALSIFSIFAASTYAVYLYLEIIYPDGFNTKCGITLKGLFLRAYSLPGPDVSLHFFLSNCELRDGNSQNNKDDKNRVIMVIIKFLILSQIRTAKFVCIRVCIAVGSFYVMVILTGPSIG